MVAKGRDARRAPANLDIGARSAIGADHRNLPSFVPRYRGRAAGVPQKTDRRATPTSTAVSTVLSLRAGTTVAPAPAEHSPSGVRAGPARTPRPSRASRLPSAPAAALPTQRRRQRAIDHIDAARTRGEHRDRRTTAAPAHTARPAVAAGASPAPAATGGTRRQRPRTALRPASTAATPTAAGIARAAAAAGARYIPGVRDRAETLSADAIAGAVGPLAPAAPVASRTARASANGLARPAATSVRALAARSAIGIDGGPPTAATPPPPPPRLAPPPARATTRCPRPSRRARAPRPPPGRSRPPRRRPCRTPRGMRAAAHRCNP
jgi:hypothetical protein